MTARHLLIVLGGWLLATALSLLLVVIVVVRLPVTYFLDDRPSPAAGSPWARRIVRIARNAAGVVLILIGLLLSVPGIPGQGVLTMLIGIMLVDFPGRRRLERRLVAWPGVLATLNRVRAWFGRPPLVLGEPRVEDHPREP